MESEIMSLIARVAAGDNVAFAELSERYYPLVKSMVRKYSGMIDADDDQVREDLAQEAALALYRAAISFESKDGKISFGLYSKICIRNALVSELRRLTRKSRADQKQQKDDDFGREKSSLPIDSDMMKSILDGDILSDFEKDVFIMYVEGVKVRGIAASLGKSSKSVSNAVYRIKSKLRLSLESDV